MLAIHGNPIPNLVYQGLRVADVVSFHAALCLLPSCAHVLQGRFTVRRLTAAGEMGEEGCGYRGESLVQVASCPFRVTGMRASRRVDLCISAIMSPITRTVPWSADEVH